MRGLLLTLAALALGAPGATRLIRCDGKLCGFDRPEDLAILADSRVLVSDDKAVMIVDPETGGRVPLVADRPLRPGGNDARGDRIVVIDKGPPERLVFFQRDGVDAAHFTSAVDVPKPWHLNDVALAPDGTVYATHEFDPALGPQLRQMFLARQPTGYAIRWQPTAGWSRVAGTELSFANGIALSPDGETLAVAGTFDQAVLVEDLARGAIRRIQVPLQPDNITSLADGTFLVTGHTGVPVTGIDTCRPPEAMPCGFPFAVVRITRQGTVDRIFEHDGTTIPGASVAIPWQDGLLLGSSFGDRLTFVRIAPPR